MDRMVPPPAANAPERRKDYLRRFVQGFEYASPALIPPAELEWLWPGHIALRAHHPPRGRLGRGQAALLRFYIAARVTTGAPWPDEVAGAEDAGTDDATAAAEAADLGGAEDDSDEPPTAK